MTKRCFLVPRVAKLTPDGQSLSPYPVAYLLDPEECNNDDTNFWIFSDQGLKRLAHRTGWKILSYITVGETMSSTPLIQIRRTRVLPAGKEAADSERVPNPCPLERNRAKQRFRGIPRMEASATCMFQSMGARSPCLLTRVEEPQLRIGLKRVRRTNFVFTIQITRNY